MPNTALPYLNNTKHFTGSAIALSLRVGRVERSTPQIAVFKAGLFVRRASQIVVQIILQVALNKTCLNQKMN